MLLVWGTPVVNKPQAPIAALVSGWTLNSCTDQENGWAVHATDTDRPLPGRLRHLPWPPSPSSPVPASLFHRSLPKFQPRFVVLSPAFLRMRRDHDLRVSLTLSLTPSASLS